MSMAAAAHFAQSYEEARGLFLQAADAAGLDVQSHPHPLRGRDGEALAMDVALQGARNAKALLILSSACHGVEGFCGSGIQVGLMRDADWCAAVQRSGVAVLHIHALNPFGFSWWRRTTQENCDLNRNFHDFHQPLPANPAYDEIAHLLVPAEWPPAPAVQQALAGCIGRLGERAFQTAVTSGQHTHEDGLFYGGVAPTWSHQTLRHVLQDHGQRCARLGWIDLHTGLGPSGHGERIFAGRDDAVALARARAWWGPQVTSIYDGSSASALLRGLMWCAAPEECPQAVHTGMALEYGTVPVMDVIDALRADQWLDNHPEAGASQHSAIKRRLRDAFYTDTPEWKQAVLDQAREATLQGLAGLAA
jgi:Protein of unknown function (DUF2817)